MERVQRYSISIQVHFPEGKFEAGNAPLAAINFTVRCVHTAIHAADHGSGLAFGVVNVLAKHAYSTSATSAASTATCCQVPD
jgi:hypothetical protein